MKTCTKCKTEKPIEDFTRDKSRRDGRFPQCKVCKAGVDQKQYAKNASKRKALSKIHYDNNKDAHACRTLQRKYGISLEEYEELHKKQDGQCRICDTTAEENGRRLAVDHNHKTGEVRGLLCDQCNVGLGKFKDSPTRLRAALNYLEETSYYG